MCKIHTNACKFSILARGDHGIFTENKNTMIPLILGGLSAASGIASLIGQGNATRQLEQRRKTEELQYLHDKNTDFLDTDTAKSTLATLRKQNQKQFEATNNDAVKQGMSEESRVALAGKQNENYADAASRLAGFGTQYQQQVRDSSRRRLDSLDNALYNADLDKADAWGTLASSIGSVANAGFAAYGAGAFEKTAKLLPKMPLKAAGVAVAGAAGPASGTINFGLDFLRNNYSK